MRLVSLSLLVSVSCFWWSDPVPVCAQRVPWKNDRLVGSPEPPMPLTVRRLYPNIRLEQPLAVRDLPGFGRRAVLNRKGQIVTFPIRDEASATVTQSDVAVALDIQKQIADVSGERVSAARDFVLDPKFQSNGYLYVMWHIQPMHVAEGSRISRFTLKGTSPPTIDPSSRCDILRYHSGDHVGCSLRFGPDEMLYVTTGDGSRPFPPDKFSTAQDLSDLRGSVIRIDVRGATPSSPYRIPRDNPFVDRPGARGEIFAFGLRNGFRSAFHPHTGRLWVADVGWERCEFIHEIQRGGNHGWSLFEGNYPVRPDQVAGPGKRIPPPIILERSESQSITGGPFVPAEIEWSLGNQKFANQLLFGCYVNGAIWVADVSDSLHPKVQKVAESGLRIIDFAVSHQGGATRLLVLDYGGGLYELIPNPMPDHSKHFPRKLSETGLFKSIETFTPAPGVVRYRPQVALDRGSSDGDWVVGIPGTEPIASRGNKRFPVGTVFAHTVIRDQNLAKGGRIRKKVETQVLVFTGTSWDPYSYRWNTEQTDAVLVAAEGEETELPALARGNVQADPHLFAPRSQCGVCHQGVGGGGLSFRPEQLWFEENIADHDAASIRDDPAVFRTWSNLRRANVVRDVASQVEDDGESFRCAPWDRERWGNRDALDQQARSYLHVNCATCHRPGGGATTDLHLGMSIARDEMNAFGKPPLQGSFGINNASIIEPGYPERSTLLYRVVTKGPGRMPKLDGHQVSVEGAQLIHRWIAAMPKRQLEIANLSPVSEALVLWGTLQDQPSDAAARRAERFRRNTTDAVIDGVLAPWITSSNRESIGANPDAEAILALTGDAKRGEQWWKRAAIGQCRNCHRIDGTGKAFGPSLDQVGSNKSPRVILRSILSPSEQIPPRWQTTTVLTINGDQYRGLVDRQTPSKLVLKQIDGKQVEILKKEIEIQKQGATSLMPEGLIESLTAQEVADLLAFLCQPRAR